MSESVDFYAVVVVYNVHCTESQTCRALMKLADPHVHVVIYDNSTRPMNNRDFCRQQGWRYLGGQGNMGLSKAYNHSIRELKQSGAGGYVCLFDDDTLLEPEYFDMLRSASAKSSCRILVPLIYSGDTLISPCLLYPGHRIRLFRKAEEALSYTGGNLTAINSCMAIALSVFDSYQYDERIFLDGIDHQFLRDMRERGEGISVFPYQCRHEFSGTARPPVESALSRFKLFEKDYRYILRGERAAYLRLVGKRVLKLTLQYKTLSFLKVLLHKKEASQ